MNTFLQKISLAFKDSIIRRRIIFTVLILVLFRFLAAIPIPGIDQLRLESLLANNQFLGLLNIFSGGGLSQLSIVMLGVGPYITASIIFQLLTMMIPKLKALYTEEGEAGRARFTQYTRMLAVPLAVIQSFGFLVLLQNQGVIANLSTFEFIVNIIAITGGSILLMWLGELVTEFGIGNGVSLIIFAGIVASIPTVITQSVLGFDPSQIALYAGFVLAALAVIFGVVVVTEAERPVPVTYAKQVRGTRVYGGVSTYLPLRLNQAGVIPIIFALSLLLLPQMVFTFLVNAANPTVAMIATKGAAIMANSWVYAILYFLLVFLFTYFYTAVTFDPNNIANNLQKGGAFIPGVRPGESTSQYIGKIITRITLVGALFLGFIAVLPLIMQGITGIATLAIGGTGLLIVVSVVLDLLKKIDAQVSMREY